jgi:hypothetical protein
MSATRDCSPRVRLAVSQRGRHSPGRVTSPVTWRGRAIASGRQVSLLVGDSAGDSGRRRDGSRGQRLTEGLWR